VQGLPVRMQPTRGRRRVVLTVLLLIGGAVVLFGGSPANETDRTTAPLPDLPPSSSTTTTEPLSPALPNEIGAPLDDRVPGFDGVLVMTVGTPDGTEVWHWSSGPSGTLCRTAPIADVYDAQPDGTGRFVLAIHRFAGSHRLEAALDRVPVPVFWGADSFAWHAADEGRLAWLEPLPDGDIGLHRGRHVEEGIGSVPTGIYEPTDPAADHVLVGYDDLGLVLQRITSPGRAFEVVRVDITGVETGSTTGMFLGVGPFGRVAVREDSTTRLVDGPAMTPTSNLDGNHTSVVWSELGGRIGTADADSGIVSIIEGSLVRPIDVGDVSPRVLAWDPTSRFLVAAGNLPGGQGMLLFVDRIDLEVSTVLVPGSPIAVVVTPSPVGLGPATTARTE